MMKANTSCSLVAGAITTPSSKTTLHRKMLSLAIIQALACGSSALNAATITVDSAADNVTVDGSCTLREAIAAANTDTGADCTAGSGADTINFDNSLSGSTVTLGGTLDITSSLSIDGDLNDDGTPDIEINANASSRVININPDSNSIDVTLEGLTISGGNSTSQGAGVRSQFNYSSDGGVNLTISNSVISDNKASFSNGAGVSLYYTNSLTVNSSSISGNTADGRSGGGIYGSRGNISLTNSTVSGNTADDRSGGGIYSYKGNISLTNSTVSGNSARVSGGGIFAYYGIITLTDSTVSGNSSETYGGGVFSRYEDVTLTNSTVSGNTSIREGGGIRAYYGNITLTDSTVSGNTSTTDDGGGIWAKYGDITLTNSTVSGNTSTENGGGIRAYSGNITLTNSTVSGNTSTEESGGGIWMYGGSLTLTNSTVSDNSADDSGGGIFADGAGQGFSTTFSMVNSILANSDTGGDCGGGFDTITGSNSLVEDGGAACGITGVNITSLLTVDPQLDPLADNDGPTLTHLPQVGSPVIDAGDNTDCGTGLTITTDQRGGARNDGLCDIGAVEGSDPLPTVVSVQLDSTTATVSEDGSSITLNLTRSGDTLSEISVDYSTSDGTATAPGDYTANINTLNFATGVTSQTVTIDITDDSDVESDEDFTLTLSNVQLVSGTVTAELGANVATTVTITDDDVATPVDDNDDDDTSSSSDGFLGGLSPWWSVLMLTGWLRRRFGS